MRRVVIAIAVVVLVGVGVLVGAFAASGGSSASSASEREMQRNSDRWQIDQLHTALPPARRPGRTWT